jgi:mRNA-degrading endonuclease RelE of RelBE toxin-antitoxin system
LWKSRMEKLVFTVLFTCGWIYAFSIFAQVNIINPTMWLVTFDVLSCDIHLQVNITKLKFSKWRLAVLWKFTDKEISEIKINSVPNDTKDLCKNTKTIIRLRLGDYRGIFTSTSSRRIFPDNHLAFGE